MTAEEFANLSKYSLKDLRKSQITAYLAFILKIDNAKLINFMLDEMDKSYVETK